VLDRASCIIAPRSRRVALACRRAPVRRGLHATHVSGTTALGAHVTIMSGHLAVRFGAAVPSEIQTIGRRLISVGRVLVVGRGRVITLRCRLVGIGRGLVRIGCGLVGSSGLIQGQAASQIVGRRCYQPAAFGAEPAGLTHAFVAFRIK
jgi:hypothetical protein